MPDEKETNAPVDGSHTDDTTSREVMDNPLKSKDFVDQGPGDPSRPPFKSGLLWAVISVVVFAVILLIVL